MEGLDPPELERALAGIKSQAATGTFRVTQHAQQEMVEEEIGLDEVVAALQRGEILEHYPEHRRGACCLISGESGAVHFISFAQRSSRC